MVSTQYQNGVCSNTDAVLFAIFAKTSITKRGYWSIDLGVHTQTVMPGLKIRCFFWFLIIVRIFRVPVLAIAALYIVENIFDFTHRDPESDIN